MVGGTFGRQEDGAVIVDTEMDDELLTTQVGWQKSWHCAILPTWNDTRYTNYIARYLHSFPVQAKNQAGI